MNCRLYTGRQSIMCRMYGHCQYASVHFRYRCDVLLDEEILALQGLTGFDNSLVFEEDGSTVARAGLHCQEMEKDIIGIAGASGTSVDSFWEVGVDVREKYRGEGSGNLSCEQADE